MGFFDDIAQGLQAFASGVDEDLIANGTLARGEIRSMSLSGTTFTVSNALVERNCTFVLNVMMDGQTPFDASVTQRVQEVRIPQLQQPGVVLAVRVDPANHNRIAIDFASAPPEVTLAASTGPASAAEILATGTSVTVVVVASHPMGIKNTTGDPVHALTLTVAGGVDTPYQIQVGNAVPASSLPLVFPGSRLHAKLGGEPGHIVVDWSAGAAP